MDDKDLTVSREELIADQDAYDQDDLDMFMNGDRDWHEVPLLDGEKKEDTS